MTPGIHGYDFLLVAPLKKWSDLRGRFGIGEVGSVYHVRMNRATPRPSCTCGPC